LSLHVINDEGLQIWVNRAEIHKCLLLKSLKERLLGWLLE